MSGNIVGGAIGDDCVDHLKIWDSTCWATDESHYVLKQLINYDLQTVMTDTSGHQTVLNTILLYFNTGLLSAAFFIFAFILIAGVIYTAQDGQFLGRKWGSAWVPLRAVLGTLMLFPMKTSGFCFAQYIMLCVTYIGIGLANYVWYGATQGVQSGTVLPVQDITAKMELVYRIGQLMLTDLMDEKLREVIGSQESLNFNQKIPLTTETFAVRSSPQVGTQWSDWFPTSLSNSSLPRPVIDLYSPLVSNVYNGLYSLKQAGPAGGIINAYVGTLAPPLVGGECEVMRNGNCLSYVDARLTYHYNPPSPVPNDSFLEQIRRAILAMPVYAKVHDAQCFELTVRDDSPISSDIGGCISDTLHTHPVDYNLPLPKDQAGNSVDPLLRVNSYYDIVAQIQNYYLNGYDGPDRDDFIVPGSAKTDSQGRPLSQSNFGYMCGYSDLVQHDCGPDHSGRNTEACQKRNEFAGGWFCAGNRYLQFDNLLGVNAQNFRTAIQKFLTYQNIGYYKVSVEDKGSSVSYVYANIQIDPNTGNVVATSRGTSGPCAIDRNSQLVGAACPIIYKLSANATLGNNGELPPSVLTWSNLLFPPEPPASTVPGVKTSPNPRAMSLLDRAIKGDNTSVGMCNLPAITDKPLCLAYGERLKELLLDTYQSLQAHQQIADRLLTYLSVKYVEGNSNLAEGSFDATKLLVGEDEIDDPLKTTRFLYNFLTFGIYNGFIRSVSHPAIPGNLPAPPINPINVGSNTVLGNIFQGLLGAHNPDTDMSHYNVSWAMQNIDPSIGRLKTNQSGWLSSIYALGSDCRTYVANGRTQIDRPDQLIDPTTISYCNDPIIQQQHTMMQRTQVVGLALIGGVIDSMAQAYQAFSNAVAVLAENYVGQAEKAASQGMLMHGFLGGLGDIASGAMGAGPIGMAIAQGNMMIAMAHLSLQLMWLPIVLFIMGAIFSAGLSFAVIIPLTPFILFWAGKIAWILLFIEALLAAPLMALGIVYPDGHDIFGQSEPGVKLAVGMMLMPVLMVIGLLMGITLTYVVIDFTAVGFKTVMHSVLGMSGSITNAPETTQGIISCFLILFYSYILIMAFEKCFSAIHVLPEKVLQWIGIQGQKFGDQEGQQMRSQMQQAGKEGSQAGGQSATQGMQAQEQGGKATGEAAFKKQEAWMSSVNRSVDSNRNSLMGSLR